MATELDPHVDVLVNMAGGNTDLEQPDAHESPLEQVMATWRANLDANLLSAVLTTTAVLDKLRPGGSIINVGSIGAEWRAWVGGRPAVDMVGVVVDLGATGCGSRRRLAA